MADKPDAFLIFLKTPFEYFSHAVQGIPMPHPGCNFPPGQPHHPHPDNAALGGSRQGLCKAFNFRTLVLQPFHLLKQAKLQPVRAHLSARRGVILQTGRAREGSGNGAFQNLPLASFNLPVELANFLHKVCILENIPFFYHAAPPFFPLSRFPVSPGPRCFPLPALIRRKTKPAVK